MKYENDKMSYVRSPLKTKFNELTTKYASLVLVTQDLDSKSSKLYSMFLDDLNDLEEICMIRKRY